MTIIDKDVKIFTETKIGYNSQYDRKRFFVNKESGVIAIHKGCKFS